jgi:plastocyanin
MNLTRFVRSGCVLVATAILALAVTASVQAQGWGSLKGQFVLDGKAPVASPVNITKDQAFCGQFGLLDEALVVNPENGGIANVVTYLYVTRRDRVKPKVHPDLADLKNENAVMDNVQCRFEPHIVVVQAGQPITLGNKDQVGHNMNISTVNPGNPPLNQLIPANRDITHKFNAEESLPIPVVCNIHPWMKGFMVIKETPYAAVTDKDGNFEMEKLPAGKWKFKFWQEKSGFVDNVNVGGKATKWNRGEVEIEIKDGEVVDLGVIKVAPAVFK